MFIVLDRRRCLILLLTEDQNWAKQVVKTVAEKEGATYDPYGDGFFYFRPNPLMGETAWFQVVEIEPEKFRYEGEIKVT